MTTSASVGNTNIVLKYFGSAFRAAINIIPQEGLIPLNHAQRAVSQQKNQESLTNYEWLRTRYRR